MEEIDKRTIKPRYTKYTNNNYSGFLGVKIENHFSYNKLSNVVFLRNIELNSINTNFTQKLNPSNQMHMQLYLLSHKTRIN